MSPVNVTQNLGVSSAVNTGRIGAPTTGAASASTASKISAHSSTLLDEISLISRQPVLDEELTQKLPNYLQVLGQNFKVPLDESKFKSPVFSKEKEEYPDQIEASNVGGAQSEGNPDVPKSDPYSGRLIVDEETRRILTGQPREASQTLGVNEGNPSPSDDGFDLDF